MTLPNLAGMSQFPDIDLIAELGERGYDVNKGVTDEEIQDILIGYATNQRFGFVRDPKIKQLTLGTAIERIKALLEKEEQE